MQQNALAYYQKFIYIFQTDRRTKIDSNTIDQLTPEQPCRSCRQPHHPQPQEGAGGDQDEGDRYFLLNICCLNAT